MENDVAWYSHWPRSWGTGGRSCCEGGAGHGLGVDPVGRESCWVCWLQATIHKIETSYPASSPARWGNNKWTSFYHILSWLLLPSTWMRAGIQCWGNEAEQRLREGLCHSLSLVSLVREAESPKMADMIRHDAEARIMITLHKKVWVAASA